LPVTPAITNAIYDALGIRICDLPADRKKLATRLKERANDSSPTVPSPNGHLDLPEFNWALVDRL
jgi:hypothetical protein